MLLVDERLAAAKAHLTTGRFDNAALLYESVLDLSAGNLAALSGMAEVRLKQGKFKDALAFAEQASRQAPSEADALSLLAKCLLVNDRVEKARDALQDALSFAPYHSEASRLHAQMLIHDGRLKDAERVVLDALSRKPDDADLLIARSEILMKYGFAAEAVDHLEKARTLEPDRSEITALLGYVLAELGDYSEALDHLQTAHLNEPDNALFGIWLAGALLATGEVTQAYRLTRRYVGLFPEFLAAWELYLRIMAYRGLFQEAVTEFLGVAKRHSDKVASVLVLAKAYRLAGKTEEALRAIEPVLSRTGNLMPGQRDAVLTLARDCFLSLGQFDRIASTFPDFDLAACLGVRQPGEATTRQANETAEAALGSAVLVIEPWMSSLEALTLLRYRPNRLTADGKSEIHGKTAMGDIVSLVEGTRFVANDRPNQDFGDQVISALPLSAVVALTPRQRGAAKPAIPYIEADPDRSGLWARSLAGIKRPLIAISWETRPGLMLDDYRELAEALDGTLISLVWDEERHQLSEWPDVVDGGVHFQSLADLAALLANVDFVLGPDGIPMHVAGAMGVRGGLIIGPTSPWYWADRDGLSIWYPSIRVFHGRSFIDWRTNLRDVASLIAAELHQSGQETSLPADLAGREDVEPDKAAVT